MFPPSGSKFVRLLSSWEEIGVEEGAEANAYIPNNFAKQYFKNVQLTVYADFETILIRGSFRSYFVLISRLRDLMGKRSCLSDILPFN